MKNELIDRIYECSFVPELWPGVLDDLAKLVDASGGLLFAGRDRVLNWTSSAVLSEVFQTYVSDGWFAKCSRRICLMTQNQPSFFVEHDFWTEDQLNETPIYRDFFRPRGLGWSAGTGLVMPTGDSIVFSVERQFERGPIEQNHVQILNELRPHLSRAALIAARLSLKSASSASNVLALMGLPALVIDESGVVVEANSLMNELPDHVHWRAQNRIALSDTNANTLLWASLPSLKATSAASVQSFPLRGNDGRAQFVIHVIPISRSAHDIFTRSYALLIATPIAARKAPPVELLRSLFDLTPSEARVARGLAAGDSVDDIASSGGVSRNTVRAQLQQVLGKVGCARQAEVAVLLSNITLGQQDAME